MSGASGFVGTNLARAFEKEGWSVAPITRNHLKDDRGLRELIEGADAVVNLAGAPIIKKWTRTYKEEIYHSRVDTTRKIVDAISESSTTPKVFISTSAIGIYAPEGIHSEDDNELADDFLGDLAKDWEKEAMKAKELGVRTVIFRFGVVLGKGGGALEAMLPVFRAGMGGTVGDGSQPFSWIHITDLAAAYRTAMKNQDFEGVYNLTAPEPSTNRELTRVLGRVLKRPAILRVPHFALKLQYGEGADVLIKGQKVIPKRLIESGFTFQYSDIEDAIRDCVS